ncbi:MAG: nucleotidyltransferase family protein [Clostridiales bacterium]|nr:nucleotidyltransferase family protein [Clostridiales bacterium]
MRISAVICEFSPFHFGHEYLISKIKENSDAVICIMSGAFTERGEVAVLSKYARAECALGGGADLVLELPFPFCASGAEKFALGGVDIARKLTCVDEIVCGSDTLDSADITKIAARISSPEFKNALADKKRNNRTEAFGDMYFGTYAELFGDEIRAGSNDILALAYARRLVETGSDIKLKTVRRKGENYGGDGTGFASASTLRKMIFSGDDVSALVPEYSARMIDAAKKSGALYETSRLFLPLAAIYRTAWTPDFADRYEMNDELFNRVRRAFVQATTYDMAIELAKTKQYSPSKVRRAALFGALGVSGWDVSDVSFTVLLGANETGRKILYDIKNSAKIDIVTKPADYSGHAFELLQKAESLAALTKEFPAPAGENMAKSPIMI